MEKVKVTYLGKSYMYPKDITLEDISKDFQENYSETIIMAEVNGRPYELNYKVTDDVTVDFFDLTSPFSAAFLYSLTDKSIFLGIV